MPIPTSRTNEVAEIQINEALCNGCGLCVTVCKDFSLILKDKKVQIAENPLFGCLACGHCMMICPQGAIMIEGRCTSGNDLADYPSKEEAASFDAMLAMLQRRRSIREFREKPVEKELIDKVLQNH